MRFAVPLLAMCFAAGPASADIVFSKGLSANSKGQVTATFGTADTTFFDVFVDILNADGSSRCTADNICIPPGPPGSPSLTSNPFSSGEFMVSFQAMIPAGPPERITRAGLNQRQTTTDSFFDVYFEVDVGGTLMEAALGLHAIPAGPPNSPATLVTDPGKIGWIPSGPPNIPDGPPQSTFLLDPMASEIFTLTLQSDPFLTDPAPPLGQNPNIVPEPRHLLLLVAMTAILLAWHRRATFSNRQRSNQL